MWKYGISVEVWTQYAHSMVGDVIMHARGSVGYYLMNMSEYCKGDEHRHHIREEGE